jgi:hypothetical protein
MDNERDRDPFLTAPAPNTDHIFLENKPLNDMVAPSYDISAYLKILWLSRLMLEEAYQIFRRTSEMPRSFYSLSTKIGLIQNFGGK